MVVYVRRAPSRRDEPVRVGFVVSKAVGNAVVRHRTQRRLRAIMAARLPALPSGVDVVVRAQQAAATATSAELDIAVSQLLGRALAPRRIGGPVTRRG